MTLFLAMNVRGRLCERAISCSGERSSLWLRSIFPIWTLPLPLSITSTAFGGCAIFRSEEHTSELQSLMRNSYAVFCLKKKNVQTRYVTTYTDTHTATHTQTC